jgi:ribosomal protein S18 acetylase RimI-like enzyme
MPVTLRPARADDEPFLFALYGSTRADEMAAWGWEPAQRDAFLQMQFRAQRRQYEALPAPAEQRIICRDDRPIGWIATIDDQQALRLADIALLPEERNHGIGTALIQGLLDQAAGAGRPVQLHVLRTNRAIRLYQRLGFTIIGDDGIRLLMERRPGAA